MGAAEGVGKKATVCHAQHDSSGGGGAGQGAGDHADKGAAIDGGAEKGYSNFGGENVERAGGVAELAGFAGFPHSESRVTLKPAWIL